MKKLLKQVCLSDIVFIMIVIFSILTIKEATQQALLALIYGSLTFTLTMILSELEDVDTFDDTIKLYDLIYGIRRLAKKRCTHMHASYGHYNKD